MTFNDININDESLKLLIKIVLSLILGLIIGLEREHKAKSEAFAGIRTFPLVSVLGCISAFLAENYGQPIFFIILGAIVLFSLINFYLEYPKDIGITTEVSLILSFLIGVLVYYEYYYIAVFLSVIITLLLALKSILESFAKKLSQEDIFAILKFFLITIVIYPLLPDKTFGPFNALNIKDIWKVVIIVSSLDFIGYILLKWKGSNVLWINGLIGGLVSSTAVTYELSKKARQYPQITPSAALGIALAWTLMNFRVIFLSYVINPNIVLGLSIPLVIVSILYGIFIFIRYRNEFSTKQEKEHILKISNPFEISSALQFAFIYAVVLVSVKALDYYLGNKGIYLASFISGVIDVDAITISLSKLALSTKVTDVYVNGILLAAVSNSFFKFIYAAMFGNNKLKKDVFILFVIITIVCGIYILI